MKDIEQQALIPKEATPDLLIDLIGKTQQITKAAAVVLKVCRTCMDTQTKQDHVEKWGDISSTTEAVYDCADLAQKVLDAGLAMETMCAKPASSRIAIVGDMRGRIAVHAAIDPDTGEIVEGPAGADAD